MADAYKGAANAFIDSFDKALETYPTVRMLSEKTGVRRVYLVLGVGFFLASFVLFGFGSGPLCNLVGYAYPIYMSFKAINSERKDDDSQWLTYWVVFAFFNLIESFTDLLLYWVPFYYFVKMAFLLWCYLPQYEGANVIYKRFIFPNLAKFEGRVDKAIKSAKHEIGLEHAAKAAAAQQSGSAAADHKDATAAHAEPSAPAKVDEHAPSAPPADAHH